MNEIGRVISLISMPLLFIGLAIFKSYAYNLGKSSHVSGTFPIVVRQPFTWKMIFAVAVIFFTLLLILGFLMEWFILLEGLMMMITMIMPSLIGLSWSLSWKLEVFEDKMIFRNMFWHKKIIKYESINISNRGSCIRVYEQKKMIFEETIWYNNYDDLYEFISKKVKIKTFIEKKYRK